jgi:hypothetical protein
MKNILFLTFVAACLQCCKTSSADEALLKEAASVHNELISLSRSLKHTLDSLSNAGAVPADSIQAWKNMLLEWEQDVVEVPGNDHEEHDDHHNHHHHGATPEITAAEMLTVQKELKQRLEHLQRRIPVN